ncbi:SDR family NAD(P)-dependent oxidoreductase [Dyadobacter subterraneus]|uniref:SDR family NAD(P)-dependent oxidoreductase n=1 Tax=Dyadobacter subterraneus TaxID=2773304 RepID=A0ABR9W7C9_9BACT|nr:SDR family NAD(P)-dependent oxidoreductase [Dyadobacter subterraneus]MBE9461363.1 SDR family NAD(P)-dependent oxidoreductase [Dyadobacter subterraneus]
MARTIFISGASRGFGKIWTEAFLKEGYNVVATARDLSALDVLAVQYGQKILPLILDVNDRQACVAAIQQAKTHFGSIDVLINNAGFGLMGSIEEVSEEQARSIMETNFFGLLWLTQAVLPLMRQQGSGHIIQITSVLGLVTWPTLGLYNATKFAIEGLSETLAAEVKDFGIKVTMVEPAAYATDFGGVSAVMTEPLPAYDKMKASFRASIGDLSLGKPEATAGALLKIVASENPPLRLILGSVGYPLIKEAYTKRLEDWEAWQHVAIEAHGV